MALQPSGVSAIPLSFIWLENLLRMHSIASSRWLINKLNKIEPSTGPWGMPLTTSLQLESTSLIVTLWSVPFIQLLIHLPVHSFDLHFASLPIRTGDSEKNPCRDQSRQDPLLSPSQPRWSVLSTGINQLTIEPVSIVSKRPEFQVPSRAACFYLAWKEKPLVSVEGIFSLQENRYFRRCLTYLTEQSNRQILKLLGRIFFNTILRAFLSCIANMPYAYNTW